LKRLIAALSCYYNSSSMHYPKLKAIKIRK
jgi:hypothetical protein